MLPSIKRPTAQVDVVTDLDALDRSRVLAKRLETLESASAAGMTESELSARADEAKKLRSELKDIMRTVNDGTLVIDLQGLNASSWEQVIAEHTTTDPKSGEPAQDTFGVIRDAMTRMATGAHMKPTPDEPIAFSDTELAGLLGQMPDSQLLTMLPVIQRLNTPAVSLPKA
ncbi:hypothetical protein [Bifidobacterium sp. AGR2158]|uniref:hypothetical protein n=1 Tax=Bifidobacterium sp. AGR2158 TaxID=1280675 RepID=UPI00040D645B|nr:hypothetical protein [Bifidobacterium sp. AGR2158]